jgi:nitrogenase-associated protein
MARIIFYEKPGCGGNARQKALLRASGHDVEVRSLLTEPWTAARLRPFFGRKPLEQWFNPSSPRVKSGEVRAAELTPEAALLLMLDDPLLIRRPLMQVGDRRESGFDQAEVDAWIGLRKTNNPVTDTCLRPARTYEPTSLVGPQGSRIATLQGGARTVIQDLLGDFATRATRQGYKVAGVVELAPPPTSNKSCCYAVRDVSDGAIFSIGQDLGPGSTACNLDPAGLAQACHAVECAIARGVDLVILSKFGKLEAQRRGLTDAFRAAFAARVPILTSVSPKLSQAWAEFAGSESEFMSADRQDIDMWWSLVKPSMALAV